MPRPHPIIRSKSLYANHIGQMTPRNGRPAPPVPAARLELCEAVRDGACAIPDDRAIMKPEQFERLMDRLAEVRNTDDLFDLEVRLGPWDEEDALAARALFQLACTRCLLARGPAPSPDRFTLIQPAPEFGRERFEVRGRIGTRIVRVGWADGILFGSLYAIARLGSDDACFSQAASARERIVERFDVVLEEMPARAVA
ncbi:hypothetical protein BH23GEM9_BH23GEM9_35490 [soil metagenome]